VKIYKSIPSPLLIHCVPRGKVNILGGHCIGHKTKKKKLNSVAFSPLANYTDRAASACRWSYCQLLRIEGVAWSAQRIPTAVNIGFQDRSRYFSIQVAPQLSSRGWVDPVPDPLLLRNLWICSQKLWPLDHRGGHCIGHSKQKSVYAHVSYSERFPW
jgi:hypothetical protein